MWKKIPHQLSLDIFKILTGDAKEFIFNISFWNYHFFEGNNLKPGGLYVTL